MMLSRFRPRGSCHRRPRLLAGGGWQIGLARRGAPMGSSQCVDDRGVPKQNVFPNGQRVPRARQKCVQVVH